MGCAEALLRNLRKMRSVATSTRPYRPNRELALSLDSTQGGPGVRTGLLSGMCLSLSFLDMVRHMPRQWSVS